VFPGNNIRGFFGEVEVTVRKEAEANGAKLETLGDFIALLSVIKEQIQHNAEGEPANTVTGTGRLLFEQGRHSESSEVEYSMQSEVLLEGSGSSQTLKVIEGTVTAKNAEDETVTVRTGEQITSSEDGFNPAGVKAFDYSDLNLGFADGYTSVECPQDCPRGKMQTPFPGCSCIKESSGTGCSSAFVLPLILIAALLLRHS